MRHTRLVPIVLAGQGVAPWSVTVDSFPQSLGSNILVNGNMELGSPPTGWNPTNGTTAAVADERTGGAGLQSLELTASTASPTIARGVGSGATAVGDWVEFGGWIKSPNNHLMNIEYLDTTVSGVPINGTYITANAWTQVATLRRVTATACTLRAGIYSATIGNKGQWDDIAVKKITLNPHTTLPSADAQIEADFTLPVSPYVSQSVNLFYRITGTLVTGAQYWRAYIYRNAANDAWYFGLVLVNGNTETAKITISSSIGTPDSLKVVCIGNEHRCYTREGGVWTQRGPAITDATYNDQKGVNVITCSGITASALRGSTPTPFDSGLSGERYFFVHGDSKSIPFTQSNMFSWDFLYKYYAEAQTHNKWTVAANKAVGGYILQQAKDGIDAALATVNATPVPEIAMLNFGANDSNSAQVEATWKANYLYVCDALRTKWSGIEIYIMRPWKRDKDAECDVFAVWIADIAASRAFTHLGPDEREFLENGDNGVTYSEDGTHPNANGYALTAQQWVSVTL